MAAALWLRISEPKRHTHFTVSVCSHEMNLNSEFMASSILQIEWTETNICILLSTWTRLTDNAKSPGSLTSFLYRYLNCSSDTDLVQFYFLPYSFLLLNYEHFEECFPFIFVPYSLLFCMLRIWNVVNKLFK